MCLVPAGILISAHLACSVGSYDLVKEALEGRLFRCDRWLLSCRCRCSWGYLEGSITDVVDVSRCEVRHEEKTVDVDLYAKAVVSCLNGIIEYVFAAR